jgi:hypothetical protein
MMENAVMNRTNPHFKSRYADLGSILDAVRPALSANGLSVTQPIQITEHGLVLATILMHRSGQYIRAEYPLPSTPNQQQMGSALTYARRYSLAAIVSNAFDEDDDGNDAVHAGNDPKGQVTDQRHDEARRYFEACRIRIANAIDYKAVQDWWNAEATMQKMSDLGLSQAEIAELEDMVNAKVPT